MFATATRNFVEEVDPGGSLIPVSSLNDSIAILTVVIKNKRYFWQKPKYRPSDFTLNDILEGDTPILPAITEQEFIKYNGTYGDNIQAKVDASFIQNNVSVEVKDTSKLQSSFGSLKKEELDVQLDMSHCLVNQTRMNRKQVFGIVKERIMTTQPSSVIEEVQKEGQCGETLKMGSRDKDSNVTMEILPHTTLAYTLMELEVLMCDVCMAALEDLNHHFEAHAALPPQLKSSLLQKISNVIDDPPAGQCALESGELPLSAMNTLTDEDYERVRHLFSSCKVLLTKDGDTLRTEIQQGAGKLPLILCIAVRGLAAFTQ
uniref:Gasdermin Eb n=1 Tax=Neogobius melanostomus TaxID=47308 RepID=A0A8C6SYT1_9GOBI